MVCIVIVSIVIGIYFICKKDNFDSSKSAKDMLLDKYYSREEREEAEKLFYKDNNPVKIDDCTLSMEGLIYDGTTRKGSYLLVVSQEEGKVILEEYFKRFAIVINGGCAYDMDWEEIGKKLYFYFEYEMDLPWDEILYVYDELAHMNGHITETAVGNFPLRDIKNERTYVRGEDVLVLFTMNIDIKAKDEIKYSTKYF